MPLKVQALEEAGVLPEAVPTQAEEEEVEDQPIQAEEEEEQPIQVEVVALYLE